MQYEVHDKGNGTVIVAWSLEGGKKKSIELGVGLPGEVAVRGAPDAGLIRQRRRIREKTWALVARLFGEREVRIVGLEQALDRALASDVIPPKKGKHKKGS